MVTFAVLFPGQGSQHVGMGAALFGARPDLLGERADEILGWSLRKMCLDGPEGALTRTEHAQPALYALAYALWTCLEEALSGVPSASAGHSLGEYTALAAAGALGFDDGLRVVARRGRAMAAAADAEPSGMAALIGADEETAETVAAACRAAGGRLQVANLNAPGQVVVAGGSEDIAWVSQNGGDFGVRRVIPLKVAGAFHSSFMEPATGDLEEALGAATLSEPGFPVWSNTTASPHTLPELAATLVRQVVSPVRFAECLAGMSATGVDRFVHVGPGDVTAGMVRKTVPEADVLVVSDMDDIGAVARALGTM
jgi:[acyl-carrier-protein] S-malonyltransferase